MWLIALLVLALVAFFVVKYMKSNTQSQQQEHDRLQQARLDASAEAQSGQANNLHDSSTASSDTPASGAAQTAAMTATAAAATVAAGAAMKGQSAASASASVSADASSSVPVSLQTGDTFADVREMIKILNLDGADARRLDINSDELTALRQGNQAGAPDTTRLDDVATRLRNMLA